MKAEYHFTDEQVVRFGGVSGCKGCHRLRVEVEKAWAKAMYLAVHDESKLKARISELELENHKLRSTREVA